MENCHSCVLTVEFDRVLINQVALLVCEPFVALGQRVVERDSELLGRVGDRLGEHDVALDQDSAHSVRTGAGAGAFRKIRVQPGLLVACDRMNSARSSQKLSANSPDVGNFGSCVDAANFRR